MFKRVGGKQSIIGKGKEGCLEEYRREAKYNKEEERRVFRRVGGKQSIIRKGKEGCLEE